MTSRVLMGDLKNPRLICLKGLLFLLSGLIAAATLILDHPTLRTGLLLALCVWSFARFYYFAFYVIERYVDRSYRFAGLLSAARYLISKRAERKHLAAVLAPRSLREGNASGSQGERGASTAAK